MIDEKKIKEIFNFRYACKKFDKNKKVKDEDIKTILNSARLSPSSFGIEPWDFVVVRTEELINKLSKTVAVTNTNKVKTSSFSVVVLSKTQKVLKEDSDYIENLLTKVKKMNLIVKRGFKFVYGKFVVSNLNKESEINCWAEKQSFIALSNMLTTASMLKIDSIALGGFNEKKVLDFLKENNYHVENKKVSVLASFGYSAEKRPNKKIRRDFDDVVTFL